MEYSKRLILKWNNAIICAIDKRFDRLPMTSHSRTSTTKKSKDMLSQNGRRLTIGSQLFRLIEQHGFENVIETIKFLCYAQIDVEEDIHMTQSIQLLEDLQQSASKTKEWK